MSTTKTTLSKSETIKDTAYPFSPVSIPFYSVNFHIVDHDVYYGDGTITSATAKAGSVIFFENGDLKDFFFMNASAGDVATVKAVATVAKRF